MCMAGMAEGPKIWGAQHYKLSICLSICISGGGSLGTSPPPPHPPPSSTGSYGYQGERESKKAKAKK